MILKPLAILISATLISLASHSSTQAPTKYEATLESLDQHPLPQWYAGAKLGIFIHWGLYSVPGWAPVALRPRLFLNPIPQVRPIAEWYLNTMRIPGSGGPR